MSPASNIGPAHCRRAGRPKPPTIYPRSRLQGQMTPIPAPLHDRADKPKGEIGLRLAAPEHIVDLAQLCAIWRRGVVTFRLRGLAHTIIDAGLPGRLRGAFGERLKA